MRTACIILALASLGASNINVGHLRKGQVLDMPLVASATSSATVAVDLSATHASGTATGTPPVFSAADGVDLNGTSDYIDVGDNDAFSFTDGAGQDSAFSVSVWINADDITQFRAVVKDDVAANREWSCGFGGGDKTIFLILTNTANTLRVESDAAQTALEGTWAHLVCTYDGSETDGGMLTYINGSPVATSALSSGTHTGMVNSAQPVYIGRISTSFANGKIQRARIYNRALPPSDISALHACGHTGCNRNAAVSGLPAVNANSLGAGLTFHATLVPSGLRTSVLPLDFSANHNHATTDNGSATYSASGYECDGSTDSIEFPVTGVFNGDAITITLRFTPDYDYTENVNRSLFDSTTGSQYAVVKLDNGGSSALRIILGGTLFNIATGAYSSFWLQNQENTLVISSTASTDLTSVWLNNNAILTADATAWAVADPSTLWVCSNRLETVWHDGEIRDFRVLKVLWTAAQVAQYDAQN